MGHIQGRRKTRYTVIRMGTQPRAGGHNTNLILNSLWKNKNPLQSQIYLWLGPSLFILMSAWTTVERVPGSPTHTSHAQQMRGLILAQTLKDAFLQRTTEITHMRIRSTFVNLEPKMYATFFPRYIVNMHNVAFLFDVLSSYFSYKSEWPNSKAGRQIVWYLVWIVN